MLYRHRKMQIDADDRYQRYICGASFAFCHGCSSFETPPYQDVSTDVAAPVEYPAASARKMRLVSK